MPNGINYCNATDWYTQDRQMNTKKGRAEMKKLSETIASFVFINSFIEYPNFLVLNRGHRKIQEMIFLILGK